jgi:tetratricopeptide (TPR) repeat protein
MDPYRAAGTRRLLAAELLREGKELKTAEKSAQKALNGLPFAGYAESEKKAYERAKVPPPADEELQTGFKAERARYVETLAQVLEKENKRARAQRLYEEALEGNPTLTASAAALAAMHGKSGRPDKALAYAAQAMLGRPNPESRKRFYDTWARAKGPGADAEAYLDEVYRKAYPSPLHAARYEKTANRGTRVVLGEVYTGAGCPPCVAADLAFDSVLERYGRGDVAVVMYHEHIPRPDPMTNPDTLTRWKWQEGRGVPTYAVDGESIPYGGGPRSAAGAVESRVRKQVEKQLEAAPKAALELSAANDGKTVRTHVYTGELKSNSGELQVVVALVEKEVTYSGENGIRFHPMVARSVARLPLRGGESFAQAQEFDLAAVDETLKKHLDDFEKYDERHNKDGKFRFMARPETVNPEHLGVVAFVQDARTREVLQAAYTDAPSH